MTRDASPWEVKRAREDGIAFGRTIAALATAEVRSVVLSREATSKRWGRVDAIASRVQSALDAAVRAQRTEGLSEPAIAAWAEGARTGFDAAMIEAGILVSATPPSNVAH